MEVWDGDKDVFVSSACIVKIDQNGQFKKEGNSVSK
jgi:hypothetical protein